MSRRLIPVFAVLALGVLALPAVADARVAYGSRVLQQGMSGSDVKVMQRYLTRVGVKVRADGDFGRRTTGRLEYWEERTGVKVNGRLSRRNAQRLRQQVEAGGASYGNEVEEPPVEKATIAPDGTAVAPASAPRAVKAIIAAGNEIHDKPYKYGGGHGRWKDSGYDCSGSVSYALHFAGLLKDAMPSGSFTSWERKGKGRWVTTYANSGHMYMVVAGLRFDTSGAKGRGGSRWTDEMRSSSGYVKRHPRGL